MADMGTDNYEQEFTLGLVEKDRSLLREINTALAKIQNGTYGICEGTGKPISKPRLEAQPWARSLDRVRPADCERPMGMGAGADRSKSQIARFEIRGSRIDAESLPARRSLASLTSCHLAIRDPRSR